jgi:hypothetical protein
MLEKLPSELFCHIISFFNVDSRDTLQNINKLLRVSHKVKNQLNNSYVRRKLLRNYPTRKRCSNGGCRSRGKFAECCNEELKQNNNIISFYCKKHKTDSMTECISIEPNVYETLLHLSSHGYTDILKLYVSSYRKLFNKTLVKEAILEGHTGTAEWFISEKLPFPDTSFLFTCIAKSYQLGAKTCIQLGMRLNQDAIKRIIPNNSIRYKYLRLYISDSPHQREVLYPGWFDSNWEFRLCCFFGNLELVKWLVEKGYGIYDSLCMDLCMSACTVDTPMQCRMENMQNMINHLLSQNSICDMLTLRYACVVNTRYPLVEKILHSIFGYAYLISELPDSVQIEHRQWLWDLCLIAIQYNRIDIYKDIRYRLLKYNLICQNTTTLEYAILYKSWTILRYFIKDGIRCSFGYTYDLHSVPSWIACLLLIAGVTFTNEKLEIYEASLQCEFLLKGLFKSNLYSQDYLAWIMEKSDRFAIFQEILQKYVIY